MSIFQVFKISRPLWSVGGLGDAEYSVIFKKENTSIMHFETGTVVGNFNRANGLYVGAFQLKNPKATAAEIPVKLSAASFQRPA